jgi:hypothetical protein
VLLPLGRETGLNWNYLNNNGRLIVQRAIDWGMGADAGSMGNVLLVVANAATPSTRSAGRKTLMESWGYTVTLIDDGDSQANFDAAMTANDVVYVTDGVSGPTLLDKVTNTTTPVVNEKGSKLGNFGFSSIESGTLTAAAFTGTDALHYITEPFGGNPVTVFSSSLSMAIPSGTLAPDLRNVGEIDSFGTGVLPVLATLEAGATLWDGGSAPARRAHVPFGAAEISQLTADGQTIMQRALEWAADANTSVTYAVLMVVADPTSLTQAAADRRALMESWGYTVTLIDDDDTTVNLGNAADAADVVYIGSGSTATDNVSKIVMNTNKGVVNEPAVMASVMGLASSMTAAFGVDQLTIVDGAHSITQGLPDPVTVFNALGVPAVLTGTLSPDLQNLAAAFGAPAVAVLESGASRHDAGTSPGRRAQLPFAGAIGSTLTADGELIVQRAIEWAAGEGGGPVAHWKLDDGTGTTAIDSVGGHDGTLANGPVWVAGQLGDALDFDGADDYVDLTSDAELDDVFAGGATVMAWIEPAGWGGSGYGRIFDKSSSPSSTGDGWAIRLNTDNGGLNFGQGFTSGRGWWRFAESSISLGSWQHIAIAYDASSTANDPVVYLDGSPVPVTRVDTPSGTLRTDVAINLRLGGHASATAQNVFDGKIDDARIYDRILDAAEIADIAAGGGGGSGSGPTPPYLDTFNARNCNSADYAGSDGTMDWTASSWTEVGESNGSCAGLVQIAEDPDIPETGSYRLMLDERLRDVIRTVDLSGFSSATLSFDYRRYNYPTTSDYFAVLVSRDGSIWSELERFSGIATDANYQTASYDISPFIQATTRIAFATKGINTLQTVYIDNVRITEGGGGSGPVCLGTLRDEFNAQVWSGSDGSLSWASNWTEIYEGGTPTGGDIMVIDDLGPYSARVRDNGTTNNGAGIQRQANLSAFASATLNFDYRRDGPDNANDYVTVEVSSDGGGSWTELDRFIGEGTNTTDPSYVPTSYDITAFMSSNTRIRFLSSPSFGNTDIVYFDNVEICLGN